MIYTYEKNKNGEKENLDEWQEIRPGMNTLIVSEMQFLQHHACVIICYYKQKLLIHNYKNKATPNSLNVYVSLFCDNYNDYNATMVTQSES